MKKFKTIFLGLIAILVLVGIFWYANYNSSPNNQTGSAINKTQEKSPGDAKIEDFSIGDPNAPIVLEEFVSPFCGACINFHKKTLPLIMKDYVETGKVRIIPRYLSALEVRLSLFCAQEQNKFKEFDDYLFAHSRELTSVEDLKSVAGKIGADQESFNKCYDSQKYYDKAVSWINMAKERNIKGTPTFFINGEKLYGNQPYEVFQEKIDAILNNQ